MKNNDFEGLKVSFVKLGKAKKLISVRKIIDFVNMSIEVADAVALFDLNYQKLRRPQCFE